MANGIFVTGGGGFVGRRVLAALPRLGRPIFALDRSGSVAALAPAVTVVPGDLLEPGTYRSALASCSVVVHLAAATGRASAGEHARVNARGTELLVDECLAAGVSRLLFVSSIATTFPDQSGYHYAQAKSRAEATVSRSGLRFAILRPTIILGPGAPILKSLEKLALLPVIVAPGGGRAIVQPVHVNDVAEIIVRTIGEDRFTNETFDVGGPERLTMAELLQRIRNARTGRTGRVLPIPLPLLQAPLRAAEAAGLGRFLPISAGQLSSFRFDGVAALTRLQTDAGREPAGIGEMVGAAVDVTRDAIGDLDAECRVFTRHLLGCDPDAYVVARYRAAHDAVPALGAGSRLDEKLVAFARKGPLSAQIADSYAGLFSPGATLRKKLVMLIAILETRPPFHNQIDRTIDGSIVGVMLRVLGKSAMSSVALVAGTLIFLPARLILAVTGRTGR